MWNGNINQAISRRNRLLIGLDISDAMINKAISETARNVAYVCAPADQIPFSDGFFNAAIACRSLHWYHKNDNAIREIKRVLAMFGTFIGVTASYSGSLGVLRQKRRAVLQEFVDSPLPDVMADFDAEALFKDHDFNLIRRAIITAKESFTLRELVGHIQSGAEWSLVPESRRHAAIVAIEDAFISDLVDGVYVRDVGVEIVWGSV